MIGNTSNFRLERLRPHHIDQLLELQLDVHKEINDPTLCVELTVEELSELLNNQTGLTVGIYDNERLIGFHSALIPGKRKDNLGLDLNLRPDVLDKVFHLEICNVHPKYRGQSFQSMMSKWLIQQFKLNEQYRYLCQTAAPHNYGSIKNTLVINVFIVELKEMYGGYDRYIFFQDILNPIEVNERTKVEVSVKDKDTQKQLFEEGYVGYELFFSNNEPKLFFVLPLEDRIPYMKK